MLDLFAKHSAIDLQLDADGDLEVDGHHTSEDIGISIGQAIDQALGNRAGIRRYGHFTLPMDECLVTSAVDLGGRYAFEYHAPIAAEKIGDFDSELVEHFWQSFAANAKCNLHVVLHHGKNGHHIAEAVFKATARAIRMAAESDPRMTGIPSTKGVL
jgi:imidazoleglycerol-phosphate dehydratase